MPGARYQIIAIVLHSVLLWFVRYSSFGIWCFSEKNQWRISKIRRTYCDQYSRLDFLERIKVILDMRRQTFAARDAMKNDGHRSFFEDR